ncbi:MAG: signal peptidase [Francisellaceae bacterium]|nr:signal peptidase [Francisellaceae bacterium]
MNFFEHIKFSEILVFLTILSGLVCLIDIVFFKHKRALSVIASSHSIDKEPKWVEYARAFFPVFLMVLLIRSFLLEPFRIPSTSMLPTLLVGDFILVNKFNYGLRLPVVGTKIVEIGHPKRGDIIVFNHISNKYLIKRVVGVGGDHILYKDKILYVNGKPVPQEFMSETIHKDTRYHSIPVNHLKETLDEKSHDIYVYPNLKSELVEPRYKFNDLIVPQNSYFVMGDNRDASDDSRYWGFVQDKDIIGRAFAIWMSWDQQNKDLRWSRIGSLLN